MSLEHFPTPCKTHAEISGWKEKECWWCYPSLFGAVAHLLSRGSPLPDSQEQFPALMRPDMDIYPEAFVASYEEPSHVPSKSGFYNLAKTAMYDMDMTLDMQGDYDLVLWYYKMFINRLVNSHELLPNISLAHMLKQKVYLLNPRNVLCEEEAAAKIITMNVHGNLQLQSKDSKHELCEFIIPNRRQRKPKNKAQD